MTESEAGPRILDLSKNRLEDHGVAGAVRLGWEKGYVGLLFFPFKGKMVWLVSVAF